MITAPNHNLLECVRGILTAIVIRLRYIGGGETLRRGLVHFLAVRSRLLTTWPCTRRLHVFLIAKKVLIHTEFKILKVSIKSIFSSCSPLELASVSLK